MKNSLGTGDRKVDRIETIVYELNGITYVPHFRNNSIYVGPGYPIHNMMRFSDVDLQMMGARPQTMMMWPRGVSGEVSDRNP